MLLYGVLLSELAIGQSVRLGSLNGGNLFSVGEESLKQRQLLQRLAQKNVPDSYVNAVRFCLSSGNIVDDPAIDVKTVHEYKKQILKP